jgi:hypothetical protein
MRRITELALFKSLEGGLLLLELLRFSRFVRTKTQSSSEVVTAVNSATDGFLDERISLASHNRLYDENLLRFCHNVYRG